MSGFDRSDCFKIDGEHFLKFNHSLDINEPHHEKNRIFAHTKTKAQISCAVTAQLISAFVFATRIVESLFFLNPKFQANSHILRLYRLVGVKPGWKP